MLVQPKFDVLEEKCQQITEIFNQIKNKQTTMPVVRGDELFEKDETTGLYNKVMIEYNGEQSPSTEFLEGCRLAQVYGNIWSELIKHKKEDAKEHYKVDAKNDIDNNLVWQAYQLVQKTNYEWENIVLANQTGIDTEYDLKLEIDKEEYFKIQVYERGWEIAELIRNIVDTNAQNEFIFGNFEEIYKKISDIKNETTRKWYEKGKDSSRLVRSLAMKLSKCLPREVEIIEQFVRTQHVGTRAEKHE